MSSFYKYNPPAIIKKFFSSFCWDSSCNKILFTFDDGPSDKTTEPILQTLRELEIKALFFCVGNNIRKYPELTKLILSEGHTIGNHTFNHKKLTSMNPAETAEEIDSFNNLLLQEHNYRVKYFRPPHGKFRLSTNRILKEKKLINIMWSLLTYDYKNDFNLVKFAVNNYLKGNSIIVLHDSLKSKDIITDSIRFITDEAAEKKFRTGEPAECLS